MNSSDYKKKVKIELLVVAALILAFAVVVAVNILSTSPAGELNVEQAQKILDETFEKVPMPQAQTAISAIEESRVTVISVEKGSNREFVLHCEYETKDLSSVYKASKEALFSSVYDFYRAQKTDGKMVNATKIRLHLDEKVKDLMANAAPLSGKIDIYIYELEEAPKEDAFTVTLNDSILRVHLDDAMLDTVFGGIVSVGKDIRDTKNIVYNGENVDIEKLNTLRTGLSSCFGLQNFSSAKPDSSPFFLMLWNDFCDEFHRNFIDNAQWSYLTNGLLMTLEITLLAALFGILIGFVCAIIRVTFEKTGKLMLLDQAIRAYLAVIRGTPVMIQLLIIYFVILLPIGVEKFPSAVICFALNSGAYVAEIVRGGIMAVDNGQVEAGRSLGLSYVSTMYHIVVPQAFKAVLPSLANEFITLLKESSVAFYIGVADLTQGGLKIRSITYSNFMPLIAVAVIYFIIVMILTKLVKILERRLRKDER